jgi:hypothetical protein
MHGYDCFYYSVDQNDYEGETLSLHVGVSFYDPERFDGKGGPLFACSTELSVDRRFQDNEPRIGVMQQGNSSVDIAFAEMRAEVNRQVMELAYFVRDKLNDGCELSEVARALTVVLRPGTPVAEPFRYSA